ncbi:MAG: hypothetical protein KJO24_05945 [Gammaproteobacteria bacterium]|nr:hypothetical protein [Gammaproteobacteria bacterium]
MADTAGQLDAFANAQAGDEQAEQADAEIEVAQASLPQDAAAHSAQAPLSEPVTRSIWVSLDNGEQLHMRHFLPAGSEAKPAPELNSQLQAGITAGEASRLESALASAKGRSVFMLHGEAECGRVYYDSQQRGLAYYLARCGYEVFVADLGARGRSLGALAGQSALTVQQLVSKAIPALLRSAQQHSLVAARDLTYDANSDATVNSGVTPGAVSAGPQVWIAHGFGAVLLSATWARLPAAQRCAQQWVFFAGRRRMAATHRAARWFVKLFCHPLTERWVNWRNAFPATRLGLGTADENADWFRTYAKWLHSSDWRDVDGFDYDAALAATPVPPTLHLAAAADTVFCNLQDIRTFITELGPHDARLQVVDRIAGSKRRYNHLAMLLDEAAEQDIFVSLEQWLEQGASSNNNCDGDNPDLEPGSKAGGIEHSRIEQQISRQAWQREVAVESYYNRRVVGSTTVGVDAVASGAARQDDDTEQGASCAKRRDDSRTVIGCA